MPQKNYLLSPIIPFFSAGGNGGSDAVGTETGENSGGFTCNFRPQNLSLDFLTPQINADNDWDNLTGKQMTLITRLTWHT